MNNSEYLQIYLFKYNWINFFFIVSRLEIGSEKELYLLDIQLGLILETCTCTSEGILLVKCSFAFVTSLSSLVNLILLLKLWNVGNLNSLLARVSFNVGLPQEFLFAEPILSFLAQAPQNNHKHLLFYWIHVWFLVVT